MFDLLIAFWEDYYQRNPVESRRTADGKVVYANTGDPLIDKWEDELARGLEPDLLEGLSPEARAREEKALERLRNNKAAEVRAGVQEGFSDSYELDNMGLQVLGRR